MGQTVAGVEHDGKPPGLDVAERRHPADRDTPVAAGVDVADGAAPAARLVVAHQAVDQRLAGHQLHLGIERGADRQPALVELLLAVTVAELAAHLLGEIARRVGVGRQHARVDAQRLGLGLLAVGARHVTVLDHAVDHPVAPRHGLVAVQERVVVVGPFGQRRQVGDLGHAQLAHGLVEVVERRRRDPVIAQAQVDLVQVEFEDLLLGIGRLDPEREQRLLDLAVEAPLVGEQEVLGHLLGDGGRALDALVAFHQHHQGAPDALEVDAVVGVEVLVLGRQEGVLDERRDRGGRQVESALAGIFSQQAAVARVDARHHGRLVVLELRVVGQVALVFPDHEPGHAREDHEQQRAGRKNEAQETGDQPHGIEPSP